jgi:hypothetical protein
MQKLHQCAELLFRYGDDEDEVDLKWNVSQPTMTRIT